jgi:uncharacterized phage-associated protein
MLSIFDVARYILEKLGGTTSMKLQKLCYYSQAWSLAWDDMPLFLEDFQAWAGGPVCPELFDEHRGEFELPADFLGSVDAGVFTDTQIETIDAVLRDYKDMEPFELSDLTHQEVPWRSARAGVPTGVRSTNIIDKETMRDYYAGLIRHEV